MLREEDKKEIRNRLEPMTNPVKFVYFTQHVAGVCQYCAETKQLLSEVTELSDKLELEVLNFMEDKDRAEAYGIDKIPATVIEGDKDYGIRFYGIPTGYEFVTILEDILQISSRKSNLPDHLKKELTKIVKPVHIQVFVTPTCPYCPKAAMTAHQFALENENITSDVVEVTEFPQLGQKYGVMGVPKVVINENHSFEGALPESLFVEHVLNAVK